MMIIGCDFHPSWQQIAWLDSETGETGEQKLGHASGDAQRFYQQLAAPVLIGIEATGNSQWFIELVEDMGHAIWIGDAAQIRASYVRKQKTDKRDAGHILRLVVEGRFPRLWTPNREERDLRQLVLHRALALIEGHPRCWRCLPDQEPGPPARASSDECWRHHRLRPLALQPMPVLSRRNSRPSCSGRRFRHESR